MIRISCSLLPFVWLITGSIFLYSFGASGKYKHFTLRVYTYTWCCESTAVKWQLVRNESLLHLASKKYHRRDLGEGKPGNMKCLRLLLVTSYLR